MWSLTDSVEDQNEKRVRFRTVPPGRNKVATNVEFTNRNTSPVKFNINYDVEFGIETSLTEREPAGK